MEWVESARTGIAGWILRHGKCGRYGDAGRLAQPFLQKYYANQERHFRFAGWEGLLRAEAGQRAGGLYRVRSGGWDPADLGRTGRRENDGHGAAAVYRGRDCYG